MEAEQLKVMFEQQLQLIKVLTERLSTTSLASPAASSVPQSVDGIAGSINEFCYEPSAGITFDAWFRRYEDLFRVDFSLQDDSWKVRLLLRKLGPAEHDKYANYILPKNPRDFTFDETLHTLSQIFGEQTSLFNIRYRCMKLVKSDADDFLTYSGIWPEIVPVSSPTTSSTLRVLSNIFSQHGLPESIVSDNGSQFTSAEFRDFCTRHTITHVRSPPYHPQSNGQAERFVDTFKRALLKARGEETSVEALQRFLFVYRTTPNDALANHQSPAEALMGRKLRTVHSSMLPTQPTESRSIPVAVGTPFKVGTPVLVRDYRPGHDSWIAGRILRKRGSVMYDVSVGQDTWTKHQKQLRFNSTPETQVCSGSIPLRAATAEEPIPHKIGQKYGSLAELGLVESLDPRANYVPVLVECRLPMAYPESSEFSSCHHLYYIYDVQYKCYGLGFERQYTLYTFGGCFDGNASLGGPDRKLS
ncbi:hypothetical protein T265_10422 [Opisthorchis viverrini]|uniref:Integrase catalytic domain-containing protein n=1 Tax=Opisthorchis viverrini TaxID=6198 RepID=A0A074ZDC6_OPIVI|nr:hypothetical protein T265_10422 [Opisthorchis viverrini]KER21195.1 hypothetical protein T265_10422 [Opisthorchis viverrini]